MYSAGGGIVVIPEAQALAVRITDSMTLMQFQSVPGVHIQAFQDCTMVMLPWTDDACRLLSNVGFKSIPASPFWNEPHPLIEGKYKGMLHQLFTSAFIILHPRCYILSDCRLGKTGSALLAIDYLQKHKAFPGGALIITTVTTMTSVWKAGIASTFPDDSIGIVHGSKKLETLKESHDWYVTNYDSVRLHEGAFVEAVNNKRIGFVLVDELTHVGNSSSQRHKAIYRLVNKTALRFVVGMTGSPGANPEPIYGMAKVINEAALPCHSKTSWLNLTTYSYGPQPFMRKPVDNVGEYIHDALTPAVRFKKEDVLDLPPVVFQDRVCSLSKQDTDRLEKLRRDAVAFANSGEAITAANAAVLLNKLLQLPLGFGLTIDGSIAEFDHKSRDNTIIDIINESDHKTVVFNMYKARLEMLTQVLIKAGISAAKIDGSVTGEKRAEILQAFSTKPDPKVLVCHPTTVGFGTELASADTLVLDGPPMLGDFSYTQTLERLSSPKQQADKISIIRVMATPEEEKLFDKLEAGQSAGRAVAALFEALKEEA